MYGDSEEPLNFRAFQRLSRCRYGSPSGRGAVPPSLRQGGPLPAEENIQESDDWHRPLRHVRAADLSPDTGQTPGMVRTEAVSARTVGSERVWMGQSLIGPHTASGNHHHGDSETAIYIVSGHPVFVFAEDGVEVRLTPGPGDYVFVPPHVPHREENPGDEDAVVVLARSSQAAIVVNLPGALTDDASGPA
jgi:uncharacterized RmlC-like cupin family protein